MDPIASSQENEVLAPPLNNPQVEHLAAQPELNPVESTEYEDDEFWPLSGKPYFNVVLAKSHVKRGFTLLLVFAAWTIAFSAFGHLDAPHHFVFLPTKLHPVLPSATVLAVVRCCGKNWEIMFCGEGRAKWFTGGWREFVIDNNLKIGDALVFELIDSSIENLKFRVQILRGDFPSELQAKVSGTSIDNAIQID